MNVNPKYLIYHDLIGLNASMKTVSKSLKDEFRDIGKIIDDTENMLISEKDNVVKQFIKKDHIFRFELPQEKEDEAICVVEVKGTKIVGRPENRLRNLGRKRWLK
jgi:RNase P/RNase MRP subunit p29